jgi:hypothetical protein
MGIDAFTTGTDVIAIGGVSKQSAMDATLDTISMDKCPIAVPLSMLQVTGQKVFHTGISRVG